jgi:threonine dehydratase
VIPIEWLHGAAQRIERFIKKTPVTFDENLGVFFKWENQQVTGSFKIRGAANKILSLQDWELENGIITCSAGNHGQGCAVIAQHKKIKCEVFCSSHAVSSKVSAMKNLGAIIHLVDGGYFEAEKTAIHQAEITGKTFISPYNDIQVIAGQGTIGLEIVEQLADFGKVQSIVVPIGGGGLLSGIGISLENINPKPKLIGTQSKASPYMHSIFYSGTQKGVTETDSLADGLSGEVDHQSITIPLVDKYADEIVLVTEKSIRNAICYAWEKHHQIIEGSAATALAAILEKKITELPAVAIVTGGNILPGVFDSIVGEQQ